MQPDASWSKLFSDDGKRSKKWWGAGWGNTLGGKTLTGKALNKKYILWRTSDSPKKKRKHCGTSNTGRRTPKRSMQGGKSGSDATVEWK